MTIKPDLYKQLARQVPLKMFYIGLGRWDQGNVEIVDIKILLTTYGSSGKAKSKHYLKAP